MSLPYPSLRQGLVGAWCPSLGASGLSLIDRSGRNNHGTLTNMGGQDNWRASGIGVALNFDGTNDYASLPSSSAITSALTFSLWFRLTSPLATASGVRYGLLSASSEQASPFRTNIAAGFNIIGVGSSENTGRLCVLTFDGANVVTVSAAFTAQDFSTATGVWYHAYGGWFGAAWKLFVNGAEDTNAQQTQRAPTSTPLNASYLGSQGPSARYTPCQLDDIRLYSRALTPAEIRLLASRRGIGLSPSAPLHDDDADLQQYPITDSPNRVHANVGGVWVPSQVRANSSGTWGNGSVRVNQGGVWSPREYHPEAVAWQARVDSAGGSVTETTMSAVSTFCRAIDEAGIRDRFVRLNLFCGSTLGSALVPLYRSTSAGGAVIGNAADTNFNFLSGDYAETGAAGGLKGNGTNKYIDTGVVPSASLSLGNTHLSTYIGQAPVSGSFPVLISSQSTSALFQLVSCTTAPSTGEAYFCENLAAGGFATTVVNPTGLFVGSAVSLSDRRCYLNGSQSGNTQTTSPASLLPNRPMFVFTNNNNGTPANYNSGRLSTYSIGLGMTAAQVAAFNSALATFRTAMGRS